MTVDYTKYENHEQLAELDRQIKAIDPKLTFGGFGLDGNRVTSAFVSLLEKGNKPIIEKLLAIGFEKRWREKVKNTDYYDPKYSGYQMRVRLAKYLR